MSIVCAIPATDSQLVKVSVLIGAADYLVQQREKKNVYNVNQPLKYWATWFLLKTFTTSGRLQAWNKQKQELLSLLRLSDGTFRRQLDQLKAAGLIRVEKSLVGRDKDISLVSYREAADIMGIPFKGTTIIDYKPLTYKNETQVFRYLIVAQEVESNQQLQLDELHRKFQKNLSGCTTEIQLQLKQIGSDMKRIATDKQYLQQELLKLQKIVFRDRSGLAEVVFSLRADVNRSCNTWADHHGYAAGQSASFLKKKLQNIGVAKVEKVFVRSDERTRLYVPCTTKGRRDGYKWIKGLKSTVWFLCDQISISLNDKPVPPVELKKAA